MPMECQLGGIQEKLVVDTEATPLPNYAQQPLSRGVYYKLISSVIRRSFRAKIIIGFALVVATCSHLYFDRQSAISAAEEKSAAMALAADQYISGRVGGLKFLVRNISEHVLNGTVNSAAYNSEVMGALKYFPEVNFVGVFSGAGDVTAGTMSGSTKFPKNINISKRYYYDEIKKLAPGELNFIFGDPVVGLQTGKRVIHVAYPVWRNGVLLSFVVVSIDTDVYAKDLTNLLTNDREAIVVLSLRKQIDIRVPSHELYFGLDVSASEPFKSWLSKSSIGNGRQVAPTDKIDKIVSYRTILTAPFVVLAAIPLSDALSLWKFHSIVEVSLVSVILSIFTFASLRLAKSKIEISRISILQRNTDNKFRLMSEYSADWVFRTSANGLDEFNSKSCFEISGYNFSCFNADAHFFDSIVHPDDRDLWGDYRESMFKYDGDLNIEFRIIRPDNSIRWINRSDRLMHDESGCFRAGVNRDITDKKVIEEKLYIYYTAVQQSPSAVIVTDRNMVIEDVNPAFSDISGASYEDSIGKTPKELLSTANTPVETFIEMKENLSRGVAWKGIFYNHRRDGAQFISSAQIWPVKNSSGDVVHFIGTQDDISEQVAREQELARYRQDLEEQTKLLIQAQSAAYSANLAKSAFLSNMSHEIRTPLNAIIGFAGLMRNTLSDADQVERLDYIETASNHLLQVINEILDISKVESGKFTLESDDFDLRRMVNGVTALLSSLATPKGLTLNTIVDCALPAWVNGDSKRLTQGLLNFASNAIKFTESGSVILEVLLLEQTDNDLLIKFSVKDTGIGISPEALGRLFSPFEQADNTISRKYGGTGLGLVLTRKFAEMMGGEAYAESTLGHGSHFWFTARLGHVDEEKIPPELGITLSAEDAARLLAQQYSGARLLLVEDVAVNRKMIEQALAQVGLSAMMAENGAVAVEALRSNVFDLVFMDMSMPVMGGLEATSIIRTLPGCDVLPIIGLTGNAFAEDRQRCLEAGMDDVVIKPVLPEVIYRALLKWLPSVVSPKDTVVVPSTFSKEESQDEQILKGISDIPGIDVAMGLKYVKKPEVYAEFLRDFADQYRNAMAEIRDHLEKQEYDDAFRIAHSLKGSPGMLGLPAVQNRAQELEAAIGARVNGSDIEGIMLIFETELGLIMKAIDSMPIW